jgi:hypothetical protein
MRSFQSDSLAMRVYPSLSAPLLTRREPDPADVDAICQGLTATQRDVLAVLLHGKSNKAICRILNLAEPTAKNHVTAILKALKNQPHGGGDQGHRNCCCVAVFRINNFSDHTNIPGPSLGLSDIANECQDRLDNRVEESTQLYEQCCSTPRRTSRLRSK